MSSEKSFTFAEINAYQSIEEIRVSLIDAEIDALLRKSLVEQFKWMENKFSVNLRTDLKVWPEFVELSQRRNLFVHSNGVVSPQYLSVCKAEGVDVSKMSVGDQLGVDSSYFRRAYCILLEVGVKLSQVLWRKLDPNGLEDAELHLNATCLKLLEQNKHNLARVLLDFGFLKSMKRFSKESELSLLVNRANAYKLAGDQEKCLEILGSDDWTAYASKFQLARAVLTDNFKEAAKIMFMIGDQGAVDKHEYREWPLFVIARKEEVFQQAFVEIFHEPLCPVEDPNADPDRRATPLRKQLSSVDPVVFQRTVKRIFTTEMAGWLLEFAGGSEYHPNLYPEA